VVVGRTVPSFRIAAEIERSKKELKFSYSTVAYDSYAKEGFELPDMWHTDKWEDRFLSEVDPGKGKVRVRVTRMIRCLATDYSSETHENKEYLY
jgi:hypothetical protein